MDSSLYAYCKYVIINNPLRWAFAAAVAVDILLRTNYKRLAAPKYPNDPRLGLGLSGL